MANLSLHQIELAGPEACSVVSLLASVAAVTQVQPLDGLVAARHFRELALISYSIGPQPSASRYESSRKHGLFSPSPPFGGYAFYRTDSKR